MLCKYTVGIEIFIKQNVLIMEYKGVLSLQLHEDNTATYLHKMQWEHKQDKGSSHHLIS